MSTIDVTAAGPIEGTFSIDLSPGPGVYEFRGARGTGKTTCISSIDLLAGHKVDVTLHDGAISGKVQGFGVVKPIGGRKHRKGDLSLDTIDADKFSITDILDPQGKTAEVRDATRIKALAVLSEVKADPALYYELVGGQAAFDSLGLPPSSDPVVLATRIKTAYDKVAREKQNTAEAEGKHAAPLELVPDGLDTSQSSDLERLGGERDIARDELQRLTDEREHGLDQKSKASAAKARLTGLRSEYSGPTVEEADTAHQMTFDKKTKAADRVEELKRELERARITVETCTTECVAADMTLSAAKSHSAALVALQAVASQTFECPAKEDIAKLAEAVEANTVAYNQGVRLRDVKQNHEMAQAHRDAEKAAAKAAEAARNKAGQVFDVFSRSLHAKYLTIKSVDGNPRLFVEHPKRGKTAFDQINGLSDGERVDFTLRELLPYIQSPGLLPIPQRVWQDLQPADRKRLHALAVEKNLYLFGAQVDDGDLRVVYLGENEGEG